MSFKTGLDRSQTQLLPSRVEDYVAEDSPVRFIDAFVDSLDLAALQVRLTGTATKGRPAYHPKVMLKICLYGYFNRIRSSRRLEIECGRNLELMWLVQNLRPDFKTIAEFRRLNPEIFAGVFREFNVLCRKMKLFAAQFIAIDGAKFQASNAFCKSYNEEQLKKILEHIDAGIAKYLEESQQADSEGEGQSGLARSSSTGEARREQIEAFQKKIVSLQQERLELGELLNELHISKKKDISRTDRDSRRLVGPMNRGTQVGYNVQVAVDNKHGLIVVAEVVPEANDFGQLGHMTEKAVAFFEETQPLLTGSPPTGSPPTGSTPPGTLPQEEEAEHRPLQVVADCGYSEADQLEECHKLNVETFVPSRPGRKRTTEDGGEPMYGKEAFRYDSAKDIYICPANRELPVLKNRSNHGKDYVQYMTTACTGCPLKKLCTKARYRVIERRTNEAFVEQANTRAKAVPETRRLRSALVERIFGTLRTWEFDKFILRGMTKVKAEFSLFALSYNLRRCFNLVPVKDMIKALQTV